MLRPLLLTTVLCACTAEVTPTATMVVERPNVEQSSSPLTATPTTTEASDAPPFDRGAAARALMKVDLQGCSTAHGTGHVTVTFAVDGTVSSAIIDGGPFPGTPEGGCIAAKFRSATVPRFSGSPVRVGKTFTIS